MGTDGLFDNLFLESIVKVGRAFLLLPKPNECVVPCCPHLSFSCLIAITCRQHHCHDVGVRTGTKEPRHVTSRIKFSRRETGHQVRRILNTPLLRCDACICVCFQSFVVLLVFPFQRMLHSSVFGCSTPSQHLYNILLIPSSQHNSVLLIVLIPSSQHNAVLLIVLEARKTHHMLMSMR